MKKNILKISLFAGVIALGIASCTSTPEQKEAKAEDAKANVVVANQELKQARMDSVNEYQAFKTTSETKIADNDRAIIDLKDKMKTDNKVARDKYNKQLAELQDRNTKLKNGVESYNETGKDKWEAFKMGFNRDMDSLGMSISKMAKNNMK